ncbi:MAG TPA: hypothetical protein VMM18_13420 [Gemmatimonadaceae bacterium]|nr:hypothetical protein [Gemmatimonadaceae bacterium]
MLSRFLILSAIVGLGCQADAAPLDELQRRPGYVIDSVFPMEEHLRRFRAELGAAPATLEGGAASREALVGALVAALAARDSAALQRLHLDRAEFAWLYFPTSAFAAAPYELPPEFLWYQMTAESNKGIGRALRIVGGGGTYLGHTCDDPPQVHGENRLWAGCEVRWMSAAGSEESGRLFGTIIERAGRFKFVSYANKL